MKNKPLTNKRTLPNEDETDEQFLIRVRTEAREKLYLNKQGVNKESLAAAMYLSEQSTFFADLSKKNFKPKKKAPERLDSVLFDNCETLSATVLFR